MKTHSLVDEDARSGERTCDRVARRLRIHFMIRPVREYMEEIGSKAWKSCETAMQTFIVVDRIDPDLLQKTPLKV
jgi:hypothetical protein